MAARGAVAIKKLEGGAGRGAEQVGFDLGASQPVRPPFCPCPRVERQERARANHAGTVYLQTVCPRLHRGKSEFVTVCRPERRAAESRETNRGTPKKQPRPLRGAVSTSRAYDSCTGGFFNDLET